MERNGVGPGNSVVRLAASHGPGSASRARRRDHTGRRLTQHRGDVFHKLTQLNYYYLDQRELMEG